MTATTETKTIDQFIKSNGIVIDSEQVDNNPNWIESTTGRGCTHFTHWKCTLKNKHRRQITLYYSMGLAHTGRPKVDDVVDCLAMDCSTVENARHFEDFANDCGYDEDSRKAEKLYKICLKQAEKLERFLGESEYNALLWDTERL